MQSLRKFIGFVLSTCTLVSHTYAQDQSLTVDLAIQESLKLSPEAKRSAAAQAESEWHYKELAGLGFLPKISANAYHYLAKQYTDTSINFGGAVLDFPGFYPTNAATIDWSIPIFDGFSSMQKLEGASLAREAAGAELANTQFHLQELTRLAFYQCLAAQELQAAAAQNVRTIQDHLKTIETEKKDGVVTKYDVLRVQVQLNEARGDAMDAEDNYAITRGKLAQILGLKSDMRPLSGTLPVPVPERVKAIQVTQDTKERLDIKALHLRAGAAEQNRKAASSWYIPSLSVGGNYMWYETQLFNVTVQDTGKYSTTFNVGIFLKWQLFDGGVSASQERVAAYQAKQAEYSAEAASLQVPYEVEYWKRRYISNTERYRTTQFDIVRSKESVRLAREEMRAGTRTNTEVLDAELDLFRAKAGVVTAQVNAAEAAIRLGLALGRQI